MPHRLRQAAWKQGLERLHSGNASRLSARLALVSKRQQGFALPIALAMGMVMALMGVTALIVAQGDRTTAFQRKETNTSLATSEGGIARTLVQLIEPNNIPLLTRNYDTINPNTGTTFLGPDGIPQSGDEESTAVDEWTGYSSATSTCAPDSGGDAPDISLSGTMGQIGPNIQNSDPVTAEPLTDQAPEASQDSNPEDPGQYTLKAYRYNSDEQTGTLLVEGQLGGSSSYVAVTLALESTVTGFPGILVTSTLQLSGRTVLGSNGNVYYNPDDSNNPSLTEYASPGDADRAAYLNALWSGPDDNVSGTIVACQLDLTVPYPATGTNLGAIDGSVTLSGSSDGVTSYQISSIDLEDAEAITVNTTDGPVYLYINGTTALSGTSKIQNIRTDGLLPQVGDLRIFVENSDGRQIALYDNACIQTAFIHNPGSDLWLNTTGDGCSSSGDTNVDGVVWVEDIDETTAGTSGIAVPEDVSSLNDLLSSMGIAAPQVKIRYVKNWQPVRY